MSGRVLGVIGGSGLYAMEGLEDLEEHAVETTFGAPSDAVFSGRLGDTRLLFLPRHGRGHLHAPHEINYRANILALKQLGAEQVVSISAVGSMKENVKPGDVVLVDQFVDRTRHRPNTFFEGIGVVAHVELADPVDAALQKALYRAAVDAGARAHRGGTYVCIEGPQFSTRAESNLYRSWGVDVIGMTNLPEARLAREAELPYATVAMVTDYDCWHRSEDDVSVAAVLAVLKQNVKTAQDILRKVAADLPDPEQSPARRALEHAVITAPDRIGDEAKAKLAPLCGRLFDTSA
ncbi:MAG TPA: S-methyl-5'-thioadenosine phosphorylase [Sandaracinaceae bacterium LLY-WYZ-13_1]|nr:S-methyl-5'-thioadenosine phosphorylase [Sandaracinaceae bacterium LLY-WYZ-13_1]